MQKVITAYVATALVFLVLDGSFLAFAASRIYRPDLDPLLGQKVRAAPAVLFYLLYVAGLVYFCVLPNLNAGWAKAAVSGAILGLVAYGAYDLTCHAVMKTWSTKVTVADMGWGAIASAAAVAAAVLATNALSRRTAA